jgi:6-phosphogluconolactonase
MLIAGSPDALARVAARRIADEIESILSDTGGCRLFLTGGATPEPVYRELAKRQTSGDIDWTGVEFFFTDERCVPPDHPHSNYRMAADALLTPIAVPPEHVHRIVGEAADLEAEASRYAGEIPESIDLMLLGIGRDGHTASLFPGSEALDEHGRLIVPVTVPVTPTRRITVTPPLIRRATRRIVLAGGVAKAGIVARAVRGAYTPRRIPVQHALPGLWILDSPAASELGIDSGRGVL